MSAGARILVAVAAVVVLAGAVGALAIYPMCRTMRANTAVTAERRDRLVKLQEVSQRITDLQQEVKRLEGALQFFDSRLPAETEIDVILREVWVTAESKGLTPRSVRTKKPEPGPRCNAQPITMTFEGPFDSFYQFLLGIEQLPRITKVRELSMQKSPTQEGHMLVDMTVDIFFEK
jgi:type IV pilus assembly protein PilO